MDQLINRVDTMLFSSDFQEYARHAEIEGCEKEMLLAYLLYCSEILKPADGFVPIRALLEAMRGWLNRAKKIRGFNQWVNVRKTDSRGDAEAQRIELE